MLDASLKQALTQAREQDVPLTAAAALQVLQVPAGELPDVMAAANAVRRRHFGDRVHLCSILNAKSGLCPEDCAFCAQSARHATAAPVYPLQDEAAMAAAFHEAAKLPIDHFGVVTSGPRPNTSELARIAALMGAEKEARVAWCASLGGLSKTQLLELKRAGLQRFHHNLETAASFFPQVCTTHSYAERLATLRDVRDAGLEVCSGGILGMGESLEQRVEFALALAQERVHSIPLNFLVPVPGTRLGDQPPMKPLDILRSIAMFRLVNLHAEIKVAAGRLHLRDLQSMVFHAGATGIMVGPLLTVAGRDVTLDRQMLLDLELES